ncbi:RNA polymerase, sigma 28 subunit, FliA/WhiG [Acidimicrobium ferrooxidans DSM 10331]|uniref:RNA polymerase, sigma 28 subunit, FliA/WhiG n=1 Tax=Acidimicrobium ferrooxidans (strain DSM 10331 / JCM 15462 / NBRC 103882 / ICP) TaxID=525909 RepID=C7LXX1_ACIFD|nr:FliA/WhiG family RNA polymerase sigma factor [Acidimicrobium ferrooxidans]ACU53579.1 RNA polymerase, sigma 28 subunit, FliA/WhiG [Acidimicrobium ferrooxidans DSM 10331]
MSDDEVIESAWRRFKHDGDLEARNRLLEHYASLVRFVASRVAVGLPASVDPNDLASYGTFGLIDALEKFEPERGIKFETYAITRIKGAIIDELRAIDWVPRSVRAKAKSVEQAYAALEARLHRPPTDAEVASELGMSEDELLAIYSKISFLGLVGLDEVVMSGERGEGMTLGDTLADRRQSAGGAFEEQERRRMLADSINQLADREKTVLVLYYYEGFTLAEIGRILGVTESRICQIHSKAVLALRGKLGDLIG